MSLSLSTGHCLHKPRQRRVRVPPGAGHDGQGHREGAGAPGDRTNLSVPKLQVRITSFCIIKIKRGIRLAN